MKRTALALLVTLVMVMMMALSTAVALAGWDYEDCPPASASGIANRSEQATSIVVAVEPPKNSHAWDENPGNKFP